MTVADMKRISQQHDMHEFDSNTMRLFGAKILVAPNEFGIYIESIDSYNREYKIYNVKAFNRVNGTTVPLNNISIEEFKTLEQAKRFRSELIKELKNKLKAYRAQVKRLGRSDNVSIVALERYQGEKYVYRVILSDGNSANIDAHEIRARI